MTNAEWAQRYAEMGWAVFPVVPGDKVPMTEHGVDDASPDWEDVRLWWQQTPEASIGLACGEVSRVWVLDVDTRTPRSAAGLVPNLSGTDALSALEFEHGELPKTMTSTTGGGGKHVFFNLPPNLKVRNRVNVKLDDGRRTGLDVRSTGGYVILPPSVHASGRAYDWSIRSPIADSPEWLLKLLFDSGGPGAQVVPLPVIPFAREATKAYAQGALRRAAEAIASCGQGSRHETIVREASSIGRYVAAGLLNAEVAAQTLIAAGMNVGKPRTEVERAVFQQFKWAQGSPKVPELRAQWGKR